MELSIDFKILTAIGSNITSYLWSTNETTSSINVSPLSSNSYTVTVTNSIGCQATSSQAITVNPTPASFTISATETSGLTNNDGTICAGAPVTLTASGTAAPTWSNGVTAQSITVSPIATTTYIATLTNAFGCSRTNSTTITVNPLPTISVTNPNPVICSGTSVTLSASPTTGLTYSWSPTGGLSNANISNPIATPTVTTTYTATGTITSTGCFNSASTTITVNSVNNTACCTAANYTYNAPINTSAMLATFPANSIIQVNADITVNQNRTFTNCTLRMGPNVKITVNSGVTLTLTNCKVFPNPSNDYFHYYLPLKEEDKGLISIIDITGKEVQQWEADYSTNQGSLDVQHYAKGIYFFELTINGNQKLIQKIIVK